MHGTIEFVKRIHNYSNYYSNSTHQINLSTIFFYKFHIFNAIFILDKKSSAKGTKNKNNHKVRSGYLFTKIPPGIS